MKAILCCAAVVFLSLSSHAQEPEDLPPPTVYVRVPVPDALYADDPASLADFEKLLSRARVREVEKAPAESINQVIAREYQFGISKTPRAYKLVEDAVRQLNKDKSADKLLIPDIAPRAWEDFNPKNPANRIPKIAAWEPAQAVVIDGETVFHGRPRIIEEGRRASQSMVIEYPVPEAQAREWKADPTFVGEILNFPLRARLADADTTTGSAYRVLTEPQAKSVSDTLAKAKRDAYLVIADSGWPGNDEYKYSVELFTRAINVVRADRLNLTDPISLGLPANLSAEPQNKHSVAIRDALRELEALDTADRIKVIYMPLTREQGAAPLLEALIATAYLVDLRIARPSIIKPGQTEIDQAAKFAKAVVDQVPSVWPEKQRQVRTDKAVLQSAMRVLNWFAEEKATDVSFFLNESWTVKHDEYYVAFPAPMRGAVLAATGNDNEQVHVDLWEFSQRCIGNTDTIAIMNYDANGPICKTGLIDAAGVDDALAVGFDGRVSAASCDGGGTSISTPRVGWLLAVGEAVRVKRFNPKRWGLDALKALKAVRSEVSLKGLLFDPVKFLDLALQP